VQELPEEVAVAVAVLPWDLNPYRLVSWWDMERLSGQKLTAVLAILERIRCDVATHPNPTGIDREFDFSGRRNEYGTQPREQVEQAMRSIEMSLEEMGLAVSRKLLFEIRNRIGATRHLSMSGPEIVASIDEVERRIRDELDSELFVHVSSSAASFFESASPFGQKVEAKFPTISEDVSEACMCIALERFTACVFHLMRVMELLVQTFGTAIGVSLVATKNWQNILDEANKAIKAMDAKQPKTKLYAEIAAHLYAVKLAWRNEVMHPKATYTGEEARRIFESVKVFAESLAETI